MRGGRARCSGAVGGAAGGATEEQAEERGRDGGAQFCAVVRVFGELLSGCLANVVRVFGELAN
jgi:hypothetical protein